ncbi:Uncharacterised protein [Mycobacteroides abscessus subsp. abscessus]|nr:Uncharacterised protein [Mycobacteroides abscessus subsp. abscessus]
MQIPCGVREIQRCRHGDKAPKIVYIKALETHGNSISGKVALNAVREALFRCSQ